MPQSTNALLGYPEDARLLIINADDFGMCQSINAAILRAFKEGVVRSTSLMAPCPWALNAMQILRENPEIPFAVHLTAIAEMHHYSWGPLTPKDKVPSLVNEAGYFFKIERMTDLLAQVKLEEIEIEFRAQIEFVLKAGLKPTQLDWHCFAEGGRADILDMTVGLAKAYGLALRISEPRMTEKLRAEGLPCLDHKLLDSYRLDTTGKSARYAQMLRDLPAGLSEWAVHPGYGNAELQALEPTSWRVRETDYEFVMSPEAHPLILQEGVILLDYRPLQAVWQRQSD
jgi:chitin disaccharide deacetylase